MAAAGSREAGAAGAGVPAGASAAVAAAGAAGTIAAAAEAGACSSGVGVAVGSAAASTGGEAATHDREIALDQLDFEFADFEAVIGIGDINPTLVQRAPRNHDFLAGRRKLVDRGIHTLEQRRSPRRNRLFIGIVDADD